MTIRVFILAVVAMILSPTMTSADVLRLEPTRMAVLPDDSSGITRVALLFDLSGVRSGSGREILHARLEWTVSGAPSQTRSEFYLHEITAGWDQARIGTGQEDLQRAADPTDDWNIETLDYSRTGGLVRFDVKDLVNRWLATPSTNFGVMVATSAVGETTLQSQMENARLVVIYGFFPGENH